MYHRRVRRLSGRRHRHCRRPPPAGHPRHRRRHPGHRPQQRQAGSAGRGRRWLVQGQLQRRGGLYGR